HGRNAYDATVSDSPQGTIASIEHALAHLDKQLEDARLKLPRFKTQREQLEAQARQPFEHENKLVSALSRQREIIEALDLTKNQAASEVDEAAQTESVTAGRKVE